MPCEWKNSSIIVLDEVTVAPPYDIENVTCNEGDTSKSQVAQRVKRVVYFKASLNYCSNEP